MQKKLVCTVYFRHLADTGGGSVWDTFDRKQLLPVSPGVKSNHLTVTANHYSILLPASFICI